MQHLVQIVNWQRYQHYKDRCPPWIKLHVSVLNDRAFMMLAPASRGLLMQLWILASENNGQVNAEQEEIRFRLRLPSYTTANLDPLIAAGFIKPLSDASNAQASASSCPPEAEGETETELAQQDFDLFWAAYPRKKGKEKARQAFAKVHAPVSVLLNAITQQRKSKQWQDTNYVPYPATWLNQCRWEDEPDGESSQPAAPVTEEDSREIEETYAIHLKSIGHTDAEVADIMQQRRADA